MNGKSPRSFYGENPLSPHAKWALAIVGVAAAVGGGVWYYEKHKTLTWTADPNLTITSGTTYRFSFDPSVVDSTALGSIFPTATAYNVSGSPLPADWPTSDPNKSNANAVFYQGVASSSGSFPAGVAAYSGA